LRLQIIDWVSVVGFFAVALCIGIGVARQAGRSSADFFLSGRKMPWWLLGVSMVATTFSTDTPNLVTDIVRQQGVAGNWVWWAFLLTGMLTAFVYAQLWRRTGVLTDVEFYELRYSGRSAAFLRAFRALYLGVLFNVIVMAAVSLAAVKIGGVMLGLSPLQTLAIALSVTTIYSTLGGLRSVVLTDFLLFIVAMFGSVAAAVVALRLPQIGGLRGLVDNPAVVDKLSILPSFDFGATGNVDFVVAAFIVPLTVQWWAAWYPGAEPGGGGYVAQRMLAARNEDHAVGATVLFNAAHYALRPWPWIVVALCSLVVFPDLVALHERFPDIPADKIGHDLAYPAMLTYLPHGLLGLVLASLIAAYMSTISTHLNWGSSYVVNDFYKRFVNPEADERRLVFVGRVSTIVMVVLAAALTLALQNALQAFTFQLVHSRIFPQGELALSWRFVIGVAVTTVAWLGVTLVTRPTDGDRLREFCRLARPGGPGWRGVDEAACLKELSHDGGDSGWDVPRGLVCMLSGSSAVYATLFATGHALYGRQGSALAFVFVAVVSILILFRVWRRARPLDLGEST
jgi:Na+/proline symporter